MNGRVGKEVQALRHRGTGAGRGIRQAAAAVPQDLHLLLGPAALLLELTRLHGGRSPPHRLAGLGVGVDHPPGRLSSPFVLHPHETVVEREVVPDRVLKQRRNTLGRMSFLR